MAPAKYINKNEQRYFEMQRLLLSMKFSYKSRYSNVVIFHEVVYGVLLEVLIQKVTWFKDCFWTPMSATNEKFTLNLKKS